MDAAAKANKCAKTQIPASVRSTKYLTLYFDATDSATILEHIMAATKKHLHRFVKDVGEPQVAEGPDLSLTRQQMAAKARVQAPQIKLERGQTQPTFETRSMAPISPQKGHKDFSVARDRPSKTLSWQGTPLPRSSGSEMWDTDAENVDNTTTISSGHSVKDDYSQTNSNAGTQLTSNDIHRDQRKYHVSHMSGDHEEHMWNGGRLCKVSHQGQNIAPLHQDYSDVEGVSSDGSADEEPADDDPTLDITDINTMAYLKPAELNDYKNLREKINESNCFSMNVSTLLSPANTMGKVVARSPLRLSSEQSRKASSEPTALPKFYGQYSNVQQNSTVATLGVGAIVDHEQTDFSPDFGNDPELSAQQLRSSGREATLSVDPDNSVHLHGLPRSPLTAPKKIPQHPKKVRGIEPEPIEFVLKCMAPTPSSMDNDEIARILNKPQLPVNQKRSVELDYEEGELSRMTYGQLKSETFDHNPRFEYSGLPDSLTTSALETQLAYISNLTEIAEEDRYLRQQGFFSSLCIEKYEECGDLILARFTQILTDFKEARQIKRSATKEFEEEVAQREQRVSTRLGLLGKNMERLRRAGQDVVNGKTV